MAANDGINQMFDKNQSDSMQFQTISNISGTEKSKIDPQSASSSKRAVGSAGMSSSSYHEKTHNNATPADELKRKKKGVTPGSNKKFESASLDLSDTSSKKYW